MFFGDMQAFLDIFQQSKPTRDGKTLRLEVFFSKFHFEFLKIGSSLVKKVWGFFADFFITTAHIQIEKKITDMVFKLTKNH